MKLKGLVMMTALLCCFAVFATAQNLQNRLPSRVHVLAASAPATSRKKAPASSPRQTLARTLSPLPAATTITWSFV